MKKYILFLLVTIISIACNNSEKDIKTADSVKQNGIALKDSTTVEIIDAGYDFGKVTDGEKVEYNYRFKNTGTKPLVIINVSATCGCTVPQKPEKPVMPGETGFIKVVFDSKGRVGSAHKAITVTSNANPGFPELQLTGEVLGKK